MPKIPFVSFPIIEYELRYMLAGIILTLMPVSCVRMVKRGQIGTAKINLGISFSIFNDNTIHETPYKTQYDHGMLCSGFSIALTATSR